MRGRRADRAAGAGIRHDGVRGGVGEDDPGSGLAGGGAGAGAGAGGPGGRRGGPQRAMAGAAGGCGGDRRHVEVVTVTMAALLVVVPAELVTLRVYVPESLDV